MHQNPDGQAKRLTKSYHPTTTNQMSRLPKIDAKRRLHAEDPDLPSRRKVGQTQISGIYQATCLSTTSFVLKIQYSTRLETSHGYFLFHTLLLAGEAIIDNDSLT